MNPADLTTWRKTHGYTQEQLGDLLGVAKNTVYRWESGMREIPSFLHLALECMEKKGAEKKKGKSQKKGKVKK
jgi:DNA-binding XRE family transcriptional regulator